MSKFNLSMEANEENIIRCLESLLKLSAIKASKLLKDVGVFDILNRPRSPEEIFHMLNFNTLEEEFILVFNVLAYFDLLHKQGEFYSDNPRRTFLEEDMREEIEPLIDTILAPFNFLFDRLASKYQSILKGEQGKLSEKELIQTLDGLYGSELFFLYREHFFYRIKNRLPLLDSRETLTVINWGVGSGFDALHLANSFKDRIMVLSIEPKNSKKRCQTLQDIYEIYNVEFFEIDKLQLNSIRECVDVFFGTPFLFKAAMKDYVQIIQTALHEEGYFAFSLVPELLVALDWILSLYENLEYNLIGNDHMAKLRHYGLSKIKYIGMDNGFMLIQKD